MISKYIALLALLFWATQGFGQQIKGTVKAQTGEAIPFANIVVLNAQLGTTSDVAGNFLLEPGKGTWRLQFSAVGFATKIQEVLVEGTELRLDVVLQDNALTLGEIVVTASKREEDILSVPTSITSLSAKKIEDTRTWGLGGLTALVPNYTYHELGVPFQQIQSIRGIQVFSENPAVSTYIDDVNNIDILANGFALTDVERIEVLRGPQGTLFGRNAMGGVVNIITKQPTNKTSGFVELGAGNFGLQRHSIGFKTPLIKDKLFFGVNGLFQTREGYWKNDTTGTGAADGRAQGKTIGDERNLYGNLFLKWLPSKRLSVTLNIKRQQDQSDGSGFFVSQSSPAVAFARPDRISLKRSGGHERNILNTSLTAKYFADKFVITSISAYQTISLSFRDIDFPGFYHSFANNTVGGTLPPQQVYSQELRISNRDQNSRRWQYTAGLYGFAQRGYEPSSNAAYELATPMEAMFYRLPIGAYVITKNKGYNYGLAGFGEVTYAIAPDWKFSAGLRYDYERREATFNGDGDAAFVNGVFTTFRADTTVNGQYAALSPKLALSHSLNDHAQVYASYTRGFRAGGINPQRYPANANIRQTFDPEYSDNYELGYKARFLDNKLSIHASAFWIYWRDLQLFNLAGPGLYARSNVGRAQSRGIELEASAIVLKGLQIDGSLGINQTFYEAFELRRLNFFTQQVSVTDIGNKSLSNAPTHTFFTGIQYERALGKKTKMVLRGEVRHIGQYYTDIQNTIRQPDYTLLNARAGILYGSYGLFVWGQNLNNQTYLAFGTADTGFGTSVRTALPRTIGLSLNANF